MSKTAATVLVAHIISMSLAHANPANLPPHAVSMAIQGATVVAYSILAAVARPVPILAIIFGSVLAVSLTLRAIVAASRFRNDRRVQRWDAAGKLLAAVLFAGVAWYAAVPSSWGASRHLGLLALYIGALPVVNALPKLVQDSSRIDNDILSTSWNLSQLAYENKKTDLVPDATYIHNPETGTRVGIGSVDKDMYIFFAGTDSTFDWLQTNMDVLTDPYPEEWVSACVPTNTARVHRGFLRAYSSVRDRVLAILGEHIISRGGSARVFIVGHSLGGALAMLAAPDIACMVKELAQGELHVVTFGAPHVGNSDFVRMFDALVQHSVRVRTLYDPVPLALSSQFSHVKGEYVISALGTDNPVTTFGFAAGKGIGSSHNIAYEHAIEAGKDARIAYAFLPGAATLGAFVLGKWFLS